MAVVEWLWQEDRSEGWLGVEMAPKLCVKQVSGMRVVVVDVLVFSQAIQTGSGAVAGQWAWEWWHEVAR